MRLLHIQQTLTSVICVTAFTVRDAPLNQTTTAPWDPTQSEPPTEPEWPFSESRANRPHPEITEDGFEVTTSAHHRYLSSKQPDIGSVIGSYLNNLPKPSKSSEAIRFEHSDDGWAELTQSHPRPSAVSPAPHLEVSEGGFNSPTAAGVPVNNQPQVTPPPIAGVPQGSPPPAITHNGLTLRPVPVTSVRVATVDGKPITVSSVVNYRYVVDTATVQPGVTTTINNVAVALKVDPLGSTVLVVGDQTTTLPASVEAAQQAHAVSEVQAVKITTTVVQGTTMYVFDGRTLAPGQAYTVSGVPISFNVQGTSTILVVGNMTTTFVDGAVTKSTPDWGASGAATFGVPKNSNAQPTATSTSTNAGNGKPRAMGWLLANIMGLATLTRTFV